MPCSGDGTLRKYVGEGGGAGGAEGEGVEWSCERGIKNHPTQVALLLRECCEVNRFNQETRESESESQGR